jgi:hypothetical protein
MCAALDCRERTASKTLEFPFLTADNIYDLVYAGASWIDFYEEGKQTC